LRPGGGITWDNQKRFRKSGWMGEPLGWMLEERKWKKVTWSILKKNKQEIKETL